METNFLTTTPTSTKSSDAAETDTTPHTIKPLSFIDATFHHPQPPPPIVAITYKECMKNHAAAMGGHAVDGCGEFMPSPSSIAANPTSLMCAACGCHRSFHRRDTDPETPNSAVITPPFLNFRHPPQPKRLSLSLSPSPPSPSPTPPAPHAPHVLFGLAAAAEDNQHAPITPIVEIPVGRKRHRTKFSQEQKEKMQSFAAKLGWKMQKCDEAAVREFCHEIRVPRGVLKVWMHNNKNTFCRKEINGGGGGITSGGVISFESSGGGEEEEEEEKKFGNINGGSSSL